MWRRRRCRAQLVTSFEHLDALFDRKQRILDRIDEDGDRQVVEELGPALNQVDMPVGRRVKGAGIEGFHAHGSALMSDSTASRRCSVGHPLFALFKGLA